MWISSWGCAPIFSHIVSLRNCSVFLQVSGNVLICVSIALEQVYSDHSSLRVSQSLNHCPEGLLLFSICAPLGIH